MRVLLISILVGFIACNNEHNNRFSRQSFSTIVNLSIDSLSKEYSAGIDSFETVVPIKDTIIAFDNLKINCYYTRFFATINYNGEKNTLIIDAFGGINRKEINDFYEENESVVEYKLEYRHIPILLNNIYYSVTLGTKFDNSINYLLNIKIKLLQNYIYFNEINSE